MAQINFDLRPDFVLKLKFKTEVMSKLLYKTKV